MRYVVWAIVVLVGIIGAAAVVGWLLPVGHVASRTANLPGAPHAVYNAVRDVANYPNWRSDVTRVEMLESAPSAVRFREHSSNGAITMEIVEATPPAKLVTRIADPSQPFGGIWTFEIEPTPGGSAITITERGEVYNPIFRIMARFVFGHYRTIDRYLADLGRHVNATARS